MLEPFQNLIEPMELIRPMSLNSELNMVFSDPAVRCNEGYVCGGGEVTL